MYAYFSGAIFTHDQKDSSTELAFKYAVYKINKDKIILPKTTLEYDIQYVPKDDSFHASKKGKCYSCIPCMRLMCLCIFSIYTFNFQIVQIILFRTIS